MDTVKSCSKIHISDGEGADFNIDVVRTQPRKSDRFFTFGNGAQHITFLYEYVSAN